MAVIRATKFHAFKTRATKLTNALVRGAKKVWKHPITKKFISDTAPQVMDAIKDPVANLPSLGQNIVKNGINAVASNLG